MECIHQNCGNGYIWHTTGSGKTLTSFKASTLLKDNPDIEKCIFVVDRKDLDRQTREEFNRFQEGCVEENTNTGALVRRLLSEDYADKVIVTTIQKLKLALAGNADVLVGSRHRSYRERLAPLQDKRIVFIFDECHRSQYGDNHKAIKEFFPQAQLFGFTGTPIFEANASLQKIEDTQASMRTTEDLFQNQLHAYTITHAIEDQNVLRFHVDYFKPSPGTPTSSSALSKSMPTRTSALPAPTKRAVTEAILAKHDAATGGRRFNALFSGEKTGEQAREIWLVDKAPVVIDRMIFDGEHLSDLMAPLDLGWKARTQKELALMEDLHPLLTKRAGGRDISGLSAYEQ